MINIRKIGFGFTIVELLVTLAIISILITAAFVIIRPLDYIKRSRDTRRLSDLKIIQTALEQYYGSEGNYPSVIPTDGSAFTNTSGNIVFLNTTPKDPLSPDQAYSYFQGACGVTGANPQKYTLCATLEMSSGTSCITATGNYCVINPF